MKSYGFGPAYPGSSGVAALPPRENWHRYKRDQEETRQCGRCEAVTLRPASEGWAYRKFSTPLFTEVRCATCLKITGRGLAEDGSTNPEAGGTDVSEEPA